MKIDVSTDFTLDTPHYWEGFWDRYDGLGIGGSDPDANSETLKQYHQIVWSRALPCGEKMNLQRGPKPYYLSWNGFHFSSDSIIAGFRYTKYRGLLDEVAKAIPDYRAFVEDYIHRAYTIGGMIIFPQHPGSINQARGINTRISDRWDLTLECIRRFYQGEDSPIYKTLLRDKGFFDLFIDFRGYVDFFYLQDYYYTKDGRSLILQTFQDCGIDILTRNTPECIDHIAITNGFGGTVMAVDEWNLDKTLSDHKGIVLEIGS